MKDSILVKKGVNANISWEAMRAYKVSERIWNKYGYECVMTSGTEGKHMEGSLHYEKNGARAIDLRTRQMPKAMVAVVLAELKAALPIEYDVLDRGTHIHAEYDPK